MGDVMKTTADNIDRAMQAASGAPLTKDQRRLLMARYVVPAWQYRVRQGLTEEPLESWRREENFKACNKTHLRACIQQDWNRLCAHYLRILKRHDAAKHMELKSDVSARNVARRKLDDALVDAVDVIDQPARYCRTIANDKFKTRDLDDLSARQLWTLVFDMRRAAQRRRKSRRARKGKKS
jgi:hypothetical protein